MAPSVELTAIFKGGPLGLTAANHQWRRYIEVTQLLSAPFHKQYSMED
jgi:hypothetical protein